jgi:hypothetical protein
LPRIPINLPGWYATWKPLRHDGAGAQKVYFSAEGVATSHGLITSLGSAALITKRGEEPVEELRLVTRQLTRAVAQSNRLFDLGRATPVSNLTSATSGFQR